MSQRHLPEGHSGAPITHDLLSIYIQWSTANSPPFQFRSTHPGADALDNRVREAEVIFDSLLRIAWGTAFASVDEMAPNVGIKTYRITS
jgi:hypothetical protein